MFYNLNFKFECSNADSNIYSIACFDKNIALKKTKKNKENHPTLQPKTKKNHRSSALCSTKTTYEQNHVIIMNNVLLIQGYVLHCVFWDSIQ